MAYSTISKPSLQFNTKLYTGNGGTQSITGVGFQPDWTWIKNRTTAGQGHHLYDAVRGVTKRLRSDSNSAESTASTGLTTFGTDGFTVGSNDGCNKNGIGIASWNWKAGTGQGSSNTDGSINTTYTSVNTTAGFSICKWSGTGSAGTIGHGLGAVPKMIICKNTDTSVNWIVYHNKLDASAPQNKYIELNATTALQDYPMWNDTAPTSSVFSVGSDIATNKSGSPMIAYCFAEKTGYSKFGSYIGNGNADGTFVYTGFKPAFIMFKNMSNSQNWYMYDNKRTPTNFANYHIYADLSNAEAGGSTLGIDILSNGWKIKTNNDGWNGSGEKYIYMAIAEEPLVANVGASIPATAR